MRFPIRHDGWLVFNLKAHIHRHCINSISESGEWQGIKPSSCKPRMIMNAFHGLCPDGYEVDHIDEVKTNPGSH